MTMNSMFSNFKNLSTTYQPNPFQPNYPSQEYNNQLQQVNINKPYEVLNEDGTIKGYFWYYGNSVDLNFDIEGEVTLLSQDEYIDVSDILKDLDLIATIYDFRMEPMIEFSNAIEAENRLIVNIENKSVLVQISNAISRKLVKGKYYLSLEANHKSGYHETLFSSESCIFEVR